jgi:hypothetical protein
MVILIREFAIILWDYLLFLSIKTQFKLFYEI